MKRDALVIGINQYPFLKDKPENEALHLQTPAADAEAIAYLLESYGDFAVHRLPTKEGVKQVNPRELLRTADLQAAIHQLFCPQGNSIPDTALLFFAGHGLRRNQDGETEGFLATSEASPRKNLWGISLKWLRQVLQESPVRQQIIWLDCCHSGELLNFTEAELGEYEKGRDRSLIVASRDFQVAYGDGEHGMLTNALLQSLDPANRPDGWVTNFTLVDRVRELLKAAPQHPVCTNTGGQIILTGKQGVLANICPYKGLAYFDWNEEDPKYFYGRTRLTKLLLEKVQSGNFLAVLGASGSGKSSVVRAGLLYQLQLGEAIPGSERWKIYPPFTPGDHPLQRLKEVVGVEAEQLEPLIKAAAAERVVLVVDQFEEVFTQCRDDGERQQFFKCLLETLERTENKLCLVLVMRSDFFGKCTEQEYSGLANKIQEHLVTVMPMNRQELEEAITKPAEQVGLEIERELVTQMIADVEGSPGNLPLLQYTLTELWERKSLNRLMLSEYTRLGGIKEALGKQANKVYEFFSDEEQKAAKRIFLELTQLGKGTEDTRRQVRQKDLVNSQQSQELVEQVIQKLADAKLIVTSDQELEQKRVAVVNIAHEALIRNWDLLGKWLKENRADLLRKQNIEDAAKEWRDKGRPKDAAYLLQGSRLIEAENFSHSYDKSLPLSGIAKEFIQESIKHRKNNRRVLAVGGIIGFFVVTFAGIAAVQWRGAEAQRQIIFARRVANQADLIREEQPELIQRSVLLAVESMKHSSSPEGEEALRRGLGLLPRTVTSFEHQSEVKAISSDGKYLAIVNKDNTVVVRDIQSGKEVAKMQHDDSVGYAVFSMDNEYLVINSMTIANKNLVKILDITNKRQVFQMQLDEPVYGVSFSPDSKYLAIAGFDQTVLILQVSSGNQVARLLHDTRLRKVTFSPDSKYLATILDDWVPVSDDTPLQTVRVFEVPSGREVMKIKQDGHLVDVVFSPNGKYLGTASTDGTARVWEASSGREVGRLTHEGLIFSIAFSSDNKYLATAGRDGSARVLDIANRNVIARMNHKNYITNVVFSSDSKYLATYSREKHIIQLWDIAGEREISRIANVSDVWKFIFSSDGKYFLITTEYDTTDYNSNTKSAITRVWEVISGQTVVAMTHKDQYIFKTVFSPDSKRLATTAGRKVRRPIPGQGRIRVWDIASGREVFTGSEELELGKRFYFSSNSEYITASLWDESLRSWEILSGKEVSPVSQENQITNSSLSPDGKYEAVQGDDVVYVQLRHPDALLSEACHRLTRNLTPEEWEQYLPNESYRKTCSKSVVETPQLIFLF